MIWKCSLIIIHPEFLGRRTTWIRVLKKRCDGANRLQISYLKFVNHQRSCRNLPFIRFFLPYPFSTPLVASHLPLLLPSSSRQYWMLPVSPPGGLPPSAQLSVHCSQLQCLESEHALACLLGRTSSGVLPFRGNIWQTLWNCQRHAANCCPLLVELIRYRSENTLPRWIWGSDGALVVVLRVFAAVRCHRLEVCPASRPQDQQQADCSRYRVFVSYTGRRRWSPRAWLRWKTQDMRTNFWWKRLV